MKPKYLPAVLWALAILIATSTYNFEALLFDGDIGFYIHLAPDLSDLFILSDIHLDSRIYVFQKTGHALSFGVLYLLIERALRNPKAAIMLCGLFALFTEVLQLFFQRSGRLFDVLIDLAGVYAAYRIQAHVRTHGGIEPAFWHSVRKLAQALRA